MTRRLPVLDFSSLDGPFYGFRKGFMCFYVGKLGGIIFQWKVCERGTLAKKKWCIKK